MKGDNNTYKIYIITHIKYIKGDKLTNIKYEGG